jgi:hypothetical protein
VLFTLLVHAIPRVLEQLLRVPVRALLRNGVQIKKNACWKVPPLKKEIVTSSLVWRVIVVRAFALRLLVTTIPKLVNILRETVVFVITPVFDLSKCIFTIFLSLLN